MTLYPNPATDGATATYKLPAGTHTAMLQLYDTFGRLRHTVALSGERGEVVFALTDLPTGLYSCRLVVGSVVVRAGTLVKQP